jgi:23S rRNA (cytosine1962-C5)-methyltransferase
MIGARQNLSKAVIARSKATKQSVLEDCRASPRQTWPSLAMTSMRDMFEFLSDPTWKDYEFLDSGDGEKLERFGNFVFARPEPKALWKKTLPTSIWEKVDAKYVQNENNGKWIFKNQVPVNWQIKWNELTFEVRPTVFKHTGVFPELSSLWKFIQEKIKNAGRPINVLNLFAYTGGSTLAAASAGASVTHLDASKSIVSWASKNAEISGLKQKPIRWIVDDSLAFVKREIKRGTKYDAIIMDPPKFGRGSDGQVWKIEDDLPKLLDLCKEVLSPEPLFFIINAYSVSFSALTLENLLNEKMKDLGGTSSCGELLLKATSSTNSLSTSIFGKWEK